MKKWIPVITLGATLAFAGYAGAKANGEKPVRGKITSITKDAKNPKAVDLVITVGGKNNPHDVTVVVDETAQITLDGQAAKLADLAEGERVQITPATGTPQTVAAITKGHKFTDAAAPAPATQPSNTDKK